MIDINTDTETTLAILLFAEALDQEQKQLVRLVKTCLQFMRTTEVDAWPDDMVDRMGRALLDFEQMVKDDATKRGIWLNDDYKLVQIMNDDTGDVQTTTVLKCNNEQVWHREGGKLGVFPQDPNQIYYGEGLVFQEGEFKAMANMNPPEEVRAKRTLEKQQKEAQAAVDKAAKRAKKNKKQKERRKRKALSAVEGDKEDEGAGEGEVAE